jgi:hypothetical protein
MGPGFPNSNRFLINPLDRAGRKKTKISGNPLTTNTADKLFSFFSDCATRTA